MKYFLGNHKYTAGHYTCTIQCPNGQQLQLRRHTLTRDSCPAWGNRYAESCAEYNGVTFVEICSNIAITISFEAVRLIRGLTLPSSTHDDVIKWKHFPRNWPFVRGIHRSPVNSPHKGQWRGALMFSLICVWINDWVNNREAGDLRRYRPHYDVIVMIIDVLHFLHMQHIWPTKWLCITALHSIVCVPHVTLLMVDFPLKLSKWK